MNDCDNDVVMGELYRDDPMFAAELLNDLLEEGTQAEVCVLLRQLAMGRSLALSAQELESIVEHLYAFRSGQHLIVLAPLLLGSEVVSGSACDFPPDLRDRLTSLGLSVICEPCSSRGAAH